MRKLLILLYLIAGGGVWHAGADVVRPEIRHEAVKIAVRGQPLTVSARVTSRAGEIKSVTLFYAVSKDVAPLRVRMEPMGNSVFVGTVPPDHFQHASEFYYYIEAVDIQDAIGETPWYTVEVKEPPRGQPAKPVIASVGTPTESPPKEETQIRWGTLALIGGGAAAIVAGALLLTDGDNGDSGGGDQGGVFAGDYSGTVIECFTPPAGALGCTNRSMTIHIGSDGVVSSSTLRPGAFLEGTLTGNRFRLVYPLDDPSWGSGEVVYEGTVTNNVISGTISGQVQGSAGTGYFTGRFDAQKR